MRTTRVWQTTIVAGLALLAGGARRVDDLDAFIQSQMSNRQIVGLSIAIIDDGKIVETRAYGTTTRGGSTRVTANTLFQAGSISKSVTAVGALKLVESGALSLDEDVNAKLVTWKVPENDLTKTARVTPRRLLSHTAGLTVHGFPGYAVGERVPSVPEVLNGKGNTPAVVVDIRPGTLWRYSGGGYTVLQQLMVDVTHQPFAVYMRDNVLRPLGMKNSTFEQPPPTEITTQTASGYYADRSAVTGRWHVYPEMAAAGLWTTASDLARFAIGVQQMVAGRSKVLSAETAKQMLTVEKNSYGLGVSIAGKDFIRFSHGGRDEGFDATVMGYAETGDGVAIMINANDNSRAISRIVNYIAQKYNWPEYPLPKPELVALKAGGDVLALATGHYEFQNNFVLSLILNRGKLYNDVDGLPDEEFVAAGNDRFVSTERAVSFKLLRNVNGYVDAMEWTANDRTRRIPLIAPLFGEAATDPDPSLTAKVLTALQQLAAGGAAVAQSTLLTEGARKDLAAANPNLRTEQLGFVHAEDVGGRGIERHGHAVSRVLQYRMATGGGTRLMLVYLDAGGLIADYDLVAH